MERLSNLPIVSQVITGKLGFKFRHAGSRSLARGCLKQIAPHAICPKLRTAGFGPPKPAVNFWPYHQLAV